MSRPRLLLVPEFTELLWTITPQLESWAEVASYDPPGVGDEPMPSGATAAFAPALTAARGLEELDRRGWDRVLVAADGWAIAIAARIAHERPQAVAGVALGHACLSFRREGDRAPKSSGVWEALTQLLRQDHDAFIRHGIAQATGGSIDEELAQRMLERFPRELILTGWERLTADEPFGQLLTDLDCPLLLAKHEGCLVSTGEGFDDAAAALPDARTIAVQDAPSTSERFADALREFCEEVWTASPSSGSDSLPGNGAKGREGR
jgi:hypothetical protein